MGEVKDAAYSTESDLAFVMIYCSWLFKFSAELLCIFSRPVLQFFCEILYVHATGTTVLPPRAVNPVAFSVATSTFVMVVQKDTTMVQDHLAFLSGSQSTYWYSYSNTFLFMLIKRLVISAMNALY